MLSGFEVLVVLTEKHTQATSLSCSLTHFFWDGPEVVAFYEMLDSAITGKQE